MSKLPKQHKFIDVSDYGRPVSRFIANAIKETSLTPIHVTIGFIISGIIAIVCILYNYFWAAAFFLILKSILDGADGELARLKKTPSYTGRYFDSVSDIILNIFILISIWFITDSNIIYTLLAFLGIQLQGTLYNYYYTILRNEFNGDTTSRVFEDEVPVAMKGEKQKHVDFLFKLYKIFYGKFDEIIYFLDRNAPKGNVLPKWFMTAVSIFGLGFQLLIISAMLVFNLKDYIIPFFIGYSVLILVFIGIRKLI
jgi:phosphatidylglycerophosphate synthase